MTNREAGINVVREMMGDQAAANLSASADSSTFGATNRCLRGRPGFCGYLDSSRSGQAILQPSCDVRHDCLRQPHEFAIHMGAGLNNGLTLKEIEEVLIQALPYVGYPAIATALAAAAEVIKERDLDGDKNYAGHRGLL